MLNTLTGVREIVNIDSLELTLAGNRYRQVVAYVFQDGRQVAVNVQANTQPTQSTQSTQSTHTSQPVIVNVSNTTPTNNTSSYGSTKAA